MISVIQPHQHKIICSHCGKHIGYDNADIKTMNYTPEGTVRYISCPSCGDIIKLKY